MNSDLTPLIRETKSFNELNSLICFPDECETIFLILNFLKLLKLKMMNSF